MIQFNLLPDVKLQYLKARRTQHLVYTAAIIAIAVSLFILVVLIGTVDVLQKKTIKDLKADIKTSSDQLKNTPNLSKILTVQNQLETLTSLHDNKPVASRLFEFVKDVTPSTASISNLSVDYTANTITITGNAASLDVINTYVDTLKFTTYKKPDGTMGNAFSSVVLTFSRGSSGATYTISAKFDPAIFISTNSVNLIVPVKTTTRSAIDQPTDLFKSTKTVNGGN
ncbi:MAG TPA: hypothetical protein VLG47_06960 [Candidatus Saccharimonadales bacterium]|nr:hypothetical protein [Candidatus Saccharimonadales bacterium]